jgi:hypothetical protein
MTEEAALDTSESDCETTGLPWPKSWPGLYLLVIASFALWVGLLIALTRCMA